MPELTFDRESEHLADQPLPALTLEAPAKINLFLQVVGKRPDGYHNLISLMCAVGLHDRVSLSAGGSGIRIACSEPGVPADDTNLACRAARVFQKALGRQDGVHITLEKRIPVAAGLGGGSSDAAVVLKGLNRLYENPFSEQALMEMGLSIGADVPFFIFGKAAVARGVGEILEACVGIAPFHVLLVCPRLSVSTAAVYKKLNLGLTKYEKKLKCSDFRAGNSDVVHRLQNDLETVTLSEYPIVGKAKQALLNHGAAGALMSGSGPAVFGLFLDQATAENARQSLADNENWRLYLTDLIV